MSRNDPAFLAGDRRWRKKPVEIEAVQFTGDNFFVVSRFMDGEKYLDNLELKTTDYPVIHTLEGKMTASPGDWIIRGVKGELYSCKPDIFAATYEPALSHADPAGEVGLLVGRLRNGLICFSSTSAAPDEVDIIESEKLLTEAADALESLAADSARKDAEIARLRAERDEHHRAADTWKARAECAEELRRGDKARHEAAIAEAVKAERERCAEIAKNWDSPGSAFLADQKDIAAAILAEPKETDNA